MSEARAYVAFGVHFGCELFWAPGQLPWMAEEYNYDIDVWFDTVENPGITILHYGFTGGDMSSFIAIEESVEESREDCVDLVMMFEPKWADRIKEFCAKNRIPIAGEPTYSLLSIAME